MSQFGQQTSAQPNRYYTPSIRPSLRSGSPRPFDLFLASTRLLNWVPLLRIMHPTASWYNFRIRGLHSQVVVSALAESFPASVNRGWSSVTFLESGRQAVASAVADRTWSMWHWQFWLTKWAGSPAPLACSEVLQGYSYERHRWDTSNYWLLYVRFRGLQLSGIECAVMARIIPSEARGRIGGRGKLVQLHNKLVW